MAKIIPEATETNAKISMVFSCNVIFSISAKSTAQGQEMNKCTSAMIKPYLLHFSVHLLLFCCPTMLQANTQPPSLLMLGLFKQLPSQV